MPTFLTDTSTPLRKISLTLLMFLLWLLTMSLGAIAIWSLFQTSLVILLLTANPEGVTQMWGFLGVLRWVVLVGGGIAWLSVVIAGLYTLGRAGDKRTLKFYFWALIIEIILILPMLFGLV